MRCLEVKIKKIIVSMSMIIFSFASLLTPILFSKYGKYSVEQKEYKKFNSTWWN